jgi:tetratricopeptide (TPR) repeat protein
MRPCSTPTRRSTWPGSSRHAGTRPSRCTSLALSRLTPTPPDVAPAEAHYQQALALAEALGMRPLQAHCHFGLGTLYAKNGRPEQARAELSTAIALYRSMDMVFWLPQAEVMLAQVEGQ